MISYYDGAEQTLENDPNKLKIIRDIVDDGLDVIHVIQRWGLTEKEALEVEAALIDAYRFAGQSDGKRNTLVFLLFRV